MTQTNWIAVGGLSNEDKERIAQVNVWLCPSESVAAKPSCQVTANGILIAHDTINESDLRGELWVRLLDHRS